MQRINRASVQPAFYALGGGDLLLRSLLLRAAWDQQWPDSSVLADLSGHGQEALDAIVFELNMRPRKRFDFKCPIEMMSELMAKYHEGPSATQ